MSINHLRMVKMEKVAFTRQILYDLVWSETLTSIAKNHRTTIDRIKKTCTENSIPLPPPGYWQRIKLGIDVEIPELPPDKAINEDTELCERTFSIHSHAGTYFPPFKVFMPLR